MTDTSAAIKMEEEELKRLKKKSLKGTKQLTAISNPNFRLERKSSTEINHSPQKSSVSSNTVPDLMSFPDICDSGKSNWSTFDDSTTTRAQFVQSQSIESVLSLYNMKTIGTPQTASVLQQQSPFRQPTLQSGNWTSDASFQNTGYNQSLVLQQAQSYFQPPSSGFTAPAQNYNLGLNQLNQFPFQTMSTRQGQQKNSTFSKESPTFMNRNAAEMFQSDFSTFSATEVEKKLQKSVSTTGDFPRPASLGRLQGYKQEVSVEQKKSSTISSHCDLGSAFGDTGISRSSSVGSKAQVTNSNQNDNDKFASVFDDWLIDGWSNNSITGSPMHEAPRLAKKKPDWLEWDPLNNSAQGVPMDKMSPQHEKGSLGAFSQETRISTDPHDNVTTRNGIGRQFSQNENIHSGMDDLVEIDETTELLNFCHMVKQLKEGFKCVDPLSNPGHVISLMNQCEDWHGHRSCGSDGNDSEDRTVRVSVTADGITDPVTFECDVNSAVEHIVSQALCIAYEDISCVSTDDFFFKVVGRQEYLISKSQLSLYQYVRECRKFEQDVKLELCHKSKIDQSLRRSNEDDSKGTVVKDFFEMLGKPTTVVGREPIQILVDTFYKETEKLLEEIKQSQDPSSCSHQLERVVQTVKAMCSLLGNLETNDLIEFVKKLRVLVLRPPTPSPVTLMEIPEGPSSAKFDLVREALEELTSSMLDLVELYCKAYEVDAYFHATSHPPVNRSMPRIASTRVKELYSVNVISVQRMPKQWEASYDDFYITCSLWYGEKQLNHNSTATRPAKLVKSFHTMVLWNKWLEFNVSVCELPLEVTLRLVLHGTTPNDEKVTSRRLAWLNIPLFDQHKIMKHHSEMYGMWELSKSSKSNDMKSFLNCSHCIINKDSVVVHIGFSEDREPTMVVEHAPAPPNSDRSLTERSTSSSLWSELDKNTTEELKSAITRGRLMAGPLFNLTQKERELLWAHRQIVAAPDDSGNPALGLPVLLQCVPQWSPSLPHLEAAHKLIASWPKQLEPVESLALLTSAFPDSEVRHAAIKWLEMAGDMEISSWLPQLVQAVRCEQRHNNSLTRLLLRRAMGSVRMCHQLYWLLNENMWDSTHGARYTVMHAALLAVCGGAMKKEFERESFLLKMVNRTAEAVKESKDSLKSSLLDDDLTKIASRIGGCRFRIPTNPALVANGINVKNSSYFTSNAVPLKLAFTNSCLPDVDTYVMYKVGDDLRQDALTMQLIRVMDRMWLCEGLDLRMVTFDCLPTGPNQGMVEIVSDSKTFREIQSSYGLTGAFKDRPITEWLQKYNPTGLSYERAVENFTLSCAGYCVATYVLGICDRHNDNIMLRNSGHLFHIDFARFLGHAQMFGNIKRDRAPFVLTSDMAYVINGGDRPSSKFQHFVDVCCLAFNILRKQSHVIINLLSLMLNCGIPELNSKSDLKFVYDTLKPNASDTEATTMFTRLIDVSLSSSFTRINFFIHNLAQMRFLGNESEEDRNILSFSPQIHPHRDEDGTISMATVVGYQKRYNPEKHYIYCVKVKREKVTSFIESYVFRTFDEFEELHRKLSYNPNLQLPSFPNSVVVGRSQVKQVAERRKQKLTSYLAQLLRSSRSVAMHDLVHTFFHPILRDEEQKVSRDTKSPDVAVGGEIKLTIHYKNNALYVMVHHCKNLSPVNGADPDPYVKTYLFPDPSHATKRKTKVARKTLHPTYNEMLMYKMPLQEVKTRKLCIGVWNYENLQENDFMGNVLIDLSDHDVTVETSKWYLLQSASL